MLASLRNLTLPVIAGALGWGVAIVVAWTIAVVVNELWLDYEKILRWRVEAGLPAPAGQQALGTASTSAILATAVWGSSCVLAYALARLARSFFV